MTLETYTTSNKLFRLYMSESVAVIGAGLVGCLAALALSKEGYQVTLYDFRHDPRLDTTQNKNLKSINLAISARGIDALKSVDFGACERILQDMIPMKGRMIHDLRGEQESQLYGLHGEAINSINRSVLNNKLLDELEKTTAELKFGHKLARIEWTDDKQICHFAAEEDSKVPNIEKFDFIIGCDGAYSATRSQMQRKVEMDYSQEYMDLRYIELYIPATKVSKQEYGGNFAIAPDHLHIWPRHRFMLIALANSDGSFTSTFFGPKDQISDLITSESRVKNFLVENFPDIVNIMDLDDAVKRFITYPKESLVCVNCKPYDVPGGKAILLGDAAHAMVPFYGQGMNCGFEDVRILMELLKKHSGDRSSAFVEYSQTRHKDLVSITELAKRNYKEMSHDVTSKRFLFRRKLDALFSVMMREKWIPLYTMVSFRSDISYSKALERAGKQTRILKFLESLAIGILSVSSFKLFKFLARERS
ncbi:kynurenine 3-monooxygenase [Saccharomyces eubayanus]|uniref:kynurenine 3-monooxygenase n=1 Tax=Saccharomyces eubayanus TaxID=1080349 RepID=UPI0006C2B61F|nr:BNA4-like protein [Saccharomyces eubayanus]KOH00756.1 BNA4-like protein [Saccharomyces eubayanus]